MYLRREVRYSGEILSLEPSKSSFRELAVVAAAKGPWRVERRALGSIDGTAVLHLYEQSYMNSFLDVSDYGREHFSVLLGSSKGDEEVPISTLRTLLAEIDAERRVFLKLDTQGMDLEILSSGTTSLQNQVAAFQIEVPVQQIYNGSSSHIECLLLLEELGFDLACVSAVSRSLDGIRLAEVDCVAVSRALALRPKRQGGR